MLKLSIHAGSIDAISRFNLLAWADIGYDKLDAIADYKTILFQAGMGATQPAPIYRYPRWSGSLWDLSARAIAVGLRDVEENITEEVPPLVGAEKRFAFASEICAVIEHMPTAGSQHRRLLGSAEIKQVGRKRGYYCATFEEHTTKRATTKPFEFRPARLRPAELLLHAALMHLSGRVLMPPRPQLCVPPSLSLDGLQYVQLHQLVEPAKTGFFAWLHYNATPPTEHQSAPLGIAPADMYVRFLKEAV